VKVKSATIQNHLLIERATQSDVPEVAHLHVHVFPGFFLTSLGTSFLEELYRGFLAHPSGIFIIAREAGRLVGFAAGTSAPDVFFPDLRRRRRVAFAIKAIPAILKNPLPVCRKLLHAIKYRGETPVPVARSSCALLSSIGVAETCRGSGLARRLIAAFEREAALHGAGFVYLTTDAHSNDRVNGFYAANGYTAVSRFLQSGKREMFRYEKSLS